jgi:hypothetical protein
VTRTRQRLPAAELTKEDVWIWYRTVHGLKPRAEPALYHLSAASDTRDAELMHWAQSWRPVEWAGALWYRGELPFGGSHYNLYRSANQELI